MSSPERPVSIHPSCKNDVEGISCLPDFLDRIFVDRYLCVDACARVAVPVPDSTEVLAGLVDFAVETQLIAELVHEIHAAETGADDEHFGFFADGRARKSGIGPGIVEIAAEIA